MRFKLNILILTILGVCTFNKILIKTISIISQNLYSEEMYWEKYCPSYWNNDLI